MENNNHNQAPQGESSNAQISRLLHDVRNPLNTISINAELGKLVLQRSGDLEKAIKVFDVILQECRNCSNKLTDLSLATKTLDRDSEKFD